MAAKFEYLNLVETEEGFTVFCMNQGLLEKWGKLLQEKLEDTTLSIIPNCCEVKVRKRFHWDKLLLIENLLGAEAWELVGVYNERLIYQRAE